MNKNGEHTLDCSSKGAYDKSLARILELMSEPERDDITTWITLVKMNEMLRIVEMGEELGPLGAARPLHGMTGREILKDFQNAKDEQAKKDRESTPLD